MQGLDQKALMKTVALVAHENTMALDSATLNLGLGMLIAA